MTRARDRIAMHWDADDFATIGVPVGTDGKEMRSYLNRQALAGECQLDYTGSTMTHEDGREYEDVAIISTHRTNPQEIARHAITYHPDWLK